MKIITLHLHDILCVREAYVSADQIVYWYKDVCWDHPAQAYVYTGVTTVVLGGQRVEIDVRETPEEIMELLKC